MSHNITVTVRGRVGSGYLRVARAIERALANTGAGVTTCCDTRDDYDKMQETKLPPDRHIYINITQEPRT